MKIESTICFPCYHGNTEPKMLLKQDVKNMVDVVHVRHTVFTYESKP